MKKTVVTSDGKHAVTFKSKGPEFVNEPVTKKYTFLVEVSDLYCEQITVEAESEEQAIKLVESDIEETNLQDRKNTYDGTETHITLIAEVDKRERLIAAAPELLEALKNLSKYVVVNTGAYPAELVKAKLAIAKAEGRDVA